MNPQVLAAIVGAAVAVCSAIVGAAWRLSSTIGAMREQLTTQIAELKTEVAVMKERENQRGDKVDQMYAWWLKSIEHGWVAYMKASAGS